jgi:transcriptional regulator with XRE-family HTH domain
MTCIPKPEAPNAAPTPDVNLCTQQEFAARNGWGKSYVSNLKKEGRLVMSDDGKHVLAAESLALIAQTTGAPESASAAVVPVQFRVDRDRKEFYDAENARLDLEERVGKLVSKAEVSAALVDAGTASRTTLEAWADNLSPELAALNGDEARIRATVRGQVSQVLTEISRKFTKLAGQLPANNPAGQG